MRYRSPYSTYILISLINFVLFIAPLHAATYYVSPSGNDTAPGTSASPWRTLNKANLTLKAGDTVLVSAGTYAERIDPSSSGTASAPIVYKSLSSTQPKIVGRVGTAPWIGATVNLVQSYIVVDGFALKQDIVPTGHSSDAIVSGSHNILRNSSFQNPRSDLDVMWKLDRQSEYAVTIEGSDNRLENSLIEGFKIGVSVAGRLAVIRGNTIRYNLYDAIRLFSGSGQIMGVLIESNFLSGSLASDGIQTNGDLDAPRETGAVQKPTTCGIVIRNNTIFDNAENGIDLKGACHIVVDGNRIYGSRGDNDGCLSLLGEGECDRSGGGAIMHGSRAESAYVIVRRNIVYDNNSGIFLLDPHWVAYNNTVVNNNRDYTGPNSQFDGITQKPPFKGLHIQSAYVTAKNNLIGGHNSVEIALAGSPATHTEIDGNLYFNGFETPLFQGTSGSHWQGVPFAQWRDVLEGYRSVTGKDLHSAVIGNPGFVNVPTRPIMAQAANLNFALSAASPAINRGVTLAHAMSVGSGNRIELDNADYFFDGFGVTEGDAIIVAASLARVVDVDYTSNTLTLDRALTWDDQATVNLPYTGSAPDVGAIEYGGSPQSSAPRPVTDTRLIPISVTASSTMSSGRPANAVDGNLSTQWSAQGEGEYLQFDLGSVKTLRKVRVAMLLGDMPPYDTRQYRFEIFTSLNGTEYLSAGGSRTTSGISEALETYNLSVVSARYVRIVGYGSTANDVNNILEVQFYR